jgi:hypothetical protein
MTILEGTAVQTRYYLTPREMSYSKEDREYILARNALIPEAERLANLECANAGYRETRGNAVGFSVVWSRTFLQKMDELARREGLIK